LALPQVLLPSPPHRLALDHPPFVQRAPPPSERPPRSLGHRVNSTHNFAFLGLDDASRRTRAHFLTLQLDYILFADGLVDNAQFLDLVWLEAVAPCGVNLR
jgi:hypothetical protein